MSIFHNNILGGAAGQGGDFFIERSLRFNSADSSYLNFTPSSAGNRRIWTWSGWIKRSKIGGTQQWVFSTSNGSANEFDFLGFDTSNNLKWEGNNGSGGSYKIEPSNRFRDPSAWMHVVLAADTTQSTASNRLKMFINGELLTSSTLSSNNYPSQNYDCRLNTTNDVRIGSHRAYSSSQNFNGYLTEVHFVDGQQLAASDFGEYDDNNVWQPIKYSGTYGTNGWYLNFSDNTNVNTLGFDQRDGVTHPPTGSTYGIWESGTPATILDGNTSTGANLRPYSSLSGQGTGVTLDTGITASTSIRIYGSSESGNYEINGTNYNSAPTFPNHAWTTLTGISFPITVNSFGLDGGNTGNGGYIFAIEIDGTVIGSNATANDWTSNNFSVASGSGNDSLLDSPSNYDDGTNVGGNYATFNYVDSSQGITMSEGNLKFVLTDGGHQMASSTIVVNSGKWYFEVTPSVMGGTYMHVGITPVGSSNYTYVGENGYAYHHGGGKQGLGTNSSYGNSYTTGDVIGCAFDADNGNLYFYKNGTIQNSGTAAFTGIDTTNLWRFSVSHQGGNGASTVNFGQRPFSISSIPSGYKAVCTHNLDDSSYAPLIDGSSAFDVITWTGNGSSNRSFTANFEPDIIWLKGRSATANHALYDRIRGAGISKSLEVNDQTLESGSNTNATYGYVSSFDSSGFSVVKGTHSFSYTNQNSATYCAWVWDTGSSTVTNTSGDISAQVRANTSTGVSIVKYEGNGNSSQDVGHGLNAKPELIIHSNLSLNVNRLVRTTVIDGSIDYGELNNNVNFNNAGGDYNRSWTTSTFSIGSDNLTNRDGDNYIAYCFTSIPGFSQVGVYKGNGQTSDINKQGRHPFINLGFTPRWIMLKNTDQNNSDSRWLIYDTARSTNNGADDALFADRDNSEGPESHHKIDLVSNGFKIRSQSTNSMTNENNSDYLYLAFAEHPFKYARAR